MIVSCQLLLHCLIHSVTISWWLTYIFSYTNIITCPTSNTSKRVTKTNCKLGLNTIIKTNLLTCTLPLVPTSDTQIPFCFIILKLFTASRTKLLTFSFDPLYKMRQSLKRYKAFILTYVRCVLFVKKLKWLMIILGNIFT